MFTRLTRSTQTLRTLRNIRQYSSQAPPPKRRMVDSFDKSMYYPAFLLVLLGSQLINVMNAQRKVEDLDRRYTLKMDKMDELIEKVRSGVPVNVEREMELVNKVFMRQSNGSSYSAMGKNTVVSKMRKEEELALNEDMDDLTEEKLASLLGLDTVVVQEAKKDLNEEPVISSKDVIKVNRSEIDEQMKKEKELLSYKLEPESHLIVENPGDYVDSAKDTKVTKFL